MGFAHLTNEQLVQRFVKLCIEQDRAELAGDTRRFRPLFDEMFEIEDELKAREGDQWRALVHLLDHPNIQVRLNAAKVTLTVAPAAARKTLKAIWVSRWYPQAAEAGMTLEALDDGTFRPE